MSDPVSSLVTGSAFGAPAPNAPLSEGAAAREPVFVPDLLNGTSTPRIPEAELKVSIALAFAGGAAGGLFSDTLERASVPGSHWDPAHFAGDLFLQQFVAKSLPLRIGGRVFQATTGHLLRVLAQPPTDPNIVQHRRGCLAELTAAPALRGQLEQLYLMLCKYRTLLEGAGGLGKWDANRRRLDILGLIKEMLDLMATGFQGATSGLARLAAFAERIRAGEPYQSLAELLHYDQNLATVNLKLGIGADGRIRGFELIELKENTQSPFVNSWFRRWLVRLELFVRGYSFSEGEVMAHLIDGVFEGLQDEVLHFVQLLGDVEFFLGALGFRELARAGGQDVCLPDIVSAEQPRKLIGLFNPLLLAAETRVVPCSLEFESHNQTVLITGPNSGGKTRLLQSLGLAQLLAQSGMFIPARSGSVAPARGLVVSLIQETRADQSEGRLGMELLRIRELFQHLPPGALVILDELCSGTNPSEGEEIFELVVKMLVRLEPQVFITTHFLSFAARLQEQRSIARLRFLQVELGPDQAPTYQFVPGVAETSLAGQTAARLGVTAAQLSALVDSSLERYES